LTFCPPMAKKLSPKLKKLISQVKGQRAKCVIDHILKHGQITTEELKNAYGYNHPPRAARDVRENGIPLRTTRVRGSDGRMIGAYLFDDLENIKAGRIGGRKAFSKQFKELLIARYGRRCTVTGEPLEPRYLQIDHRIPYEVAGDSADDNRPEDFMLLDASAQRAKSFSCEGCENFKTLLNSKICQTCFWAFPENYEHVCMKQKRMLVISWSGSDVAAYESAKKEAAERNVLLQDYIKSLLPKKS
jgi:hypothetical protein